MLRRRRHTDCMQNEHLIFTKKPQMTTSEPLTHSTNSTNKTNLFTLKVHVTL